MSSFTSAIISAALGALLLMVPSFYPMKPANTNVTVIFKSEAP